MNEIMNTKHKLELMVDEELNKGKENISSKELGEVVDMIKDLEKTIFTVNKEATIEITKQIRLRDIGGIIIIDYIDMENKEDKAKILEILEENLKKDRSKTQVIGFTPLDLLEMTRKHMWSND